MRHPDVAHNVELAFKAGGKSYYRFKEERLIPAGRYKYIYAYMKEAEMRMTRETLQNYIKDFKYILGGGSKKTVDLWELNKLVLNMESRVVLAFEPATVERLAAVIFFEEDEDLSTFDRKHGQRKIDHWTKNNVRDFFLTKPMGELLGLKNISIESLEGYIQSTQELLADLTADQAKVSLGNLSENGKKHS